MEVGILGLAGSGKTTLFSLLTANVDALGGNGRRQTAVGMAKVPDARLERLSEIFRPRKTTPAVVRYVDVPGIDGERRLDSSLNIPELRSMDALMVVLRAFHSDAVPHPLGSVNPWRDLERIEEEFVLQDQMVVERRIDRLETDLARRRAPELAAELELLRRCLGVLEQGRPLRTEGLTTDERNRLKGEISELEGEDAATFMDDLGIADRALDRISRESYRLLGLISFFTVGDDECRAWSIPSATPAVDAASAIHSDITRGFIRAEVVPHTELLLAGSLAACRDRGTLRLEGKGYPVQDGDVVHYRFNV
jgi:ribosome-binding ATPase YchF (GTP1/OBG family)